MIKLVKPSSILTNAKSFGGNNTQLVRNTHTNIKNTHVRNNVFKNTHIKNNVFKNNTLQTSDRSNAFKSNMQLIRDSFMFHRSNVFKSNTQLIRNSFRSNLALSFRCNINHTRSPLTSSFFPQLSRQYSSYTRKSAFSSIKWAKLVRPAAFTLAFCIATTVLIPPLLNYTPLAILKKNPSAVVYTLIGLNAAVFLAWKSEAPRLTRFLRQYFIIIKERLPSTWSMLGAAFSHQTAPHILVNMFVLQSFGTSLCAMVGVSNFLIMYLNSAVIASFFSLLIPVVLRRSLAVGSLGASGAIFSVFGAFSYLIPKAPIALFFIPIPGGAWYLFLGSALYNVVGIAMRWGVHDFAAHIGGCVAGIMYGWYFSAIREQIMRRRKRSVYF